MALPVRGGPCDGEVWSADGYFREVGFGGGSYFYRRTGSSGSACWDFVPEPVRRCQNCAAIVQVPAAEACPLCGSTSEAAPAA